MLYVVSSEIPFLKNVLARTKSIAVLRYFCSFWNLRSITKSTRMATETLAMLNNMSIEVTGY